MASTDMFDATSIFTIINRRVVTQTLHGGSALSLFGSVSVDLTEADVAECPAVISATAIFGNIKVVIPAGWVVDDRIFQLFGEVKDRRADQPKLKAGEEPHIQLSGVVIFGNIEITS